MVGHRWVLERFALGTNDFVDRHVLMGLSDIEAAEYLGTLHIPKADLFDLPGTALKSLCKRFDIDHAPNRFDYLFGREQNPQ